MIREIDSLINKKVNPVDFCRQKPEGFLNMGENKDF